ncbi:acylphosphatase [Dokdonella sp.]|uniref:acylphosphatase n=1 Tax=Dokdonella sp. TaxID=2291710 RepID=UPI001B29E1EF|nr:acylphosphatase [Dokdonella sp.]MBO9663349.1 acylphosphatase [Dokdonella sp.]
MATARFLVSGLVQGVCFRASTQARARQLDLTGYARNLADGRVEVVASGDAQALARLEAWLHQGPPAAEVESVMREDHAEQHHDDFARR